MPIFIPGLMRGVQKNPIVVQFGDFIKRQFPFKKAKNFDIKVMQP